MTREFCIRKLGAYVLGQLAEYKAGKITQAEFTRNVGTAKADATAAVERDGERVTLIGSTIVNELPQIHEPAARTAQE